MDDMYDYDISDSGIYFDDGEDLFDTFSRPSLTEILKAHEYTRDALFNHYPGQKNSTNDNDPESKIFGDFIEHHLTPSKIDQQKGSQQYPLSKEWISDRQKLPNKSSNRVVVKNVHPNMDQSSLKDYFQRFGFDVKSIDILRRQGKSHTAFVSFSSAELAHAAVMRYNSCKTQFCCQGRQMHLSYYQKKETLSSPSAILPEMNVVQDMHTFGISKIFYGTLLTGDALNIFDISMRNSQATSNEWGIIGHRFDKDLQNNTLAFQIDSKKRELSFVIKSPSFDTVNKNIEHRMVLEWKFRDLKRHKMTIAIINQPFDHAEEQNQIYVLMEVRRPPIILEITETDGVGQSDDTKIRHPGTPIIGNADVWLFQLDNDNSEQNYRTLFATLHRLNLSDMSHADLNSQRLRQNQRNDAMHILLLPHDAWIERNQDRVLIFLKNQWPSYSFETKFEIMKLIARRLITVHDLVIDRRLEIILRKISLKLFMACIDKIIQLAPVWLSSAPTIENESDEEEDYDDEKRNRNQSKNKFNTTNDEVFFKITLLTGEERNLSKKSIIHQPFKKSSFLRLPDDTNTGVFSRLLMFALQELHKNMQIRTEETTEIYFSTKEISPKNQTYLVRKVFVTPSMIVYEGPYNEEQSAVTRHFSKYHDRFLRLAFRDEDFRYLRNINFHDMGHIYEMIKSILKKGINICDRHYDLLAFSSSQLREHSCWLFSAVDDINVNTIRRWMGNFDRIKPAAKYSARLGQLLSTTVKGVTLERHRFMEIADVKQLDSNGREVCFTDGIGIISKRLAERLSKNFEDSHSTHASAFQIRCGGFKGMVCVDFANLLDDTEYDVYFRPSMNKFPSSSYSMDVVGSSYSLTKAFLNRQIILLLSSLNVNDESFLMLQDRMINQVLNLTQGSYGACESLRNLNEFGGNGYREFLLQFFQTFKDNREPFTQRILRSFQTFLIKELKSKAKIQLDKAWTLYGVVDESCTLNYGEVFIQIYDEDLAGKSKILKGPVLVTRNPCFHPGDIRCLIAVDVPHLHELKNVIVFPIRGQRPHPQEMSGGDLDGDRFWICHDDSLIFSNYEEPFDYQEEEVEKAEKATSEAQNGAISIGDVCDFFAEYMEFDNLGMIANSHLALADSSIDKAKDPKCLKLAKMHSKAVDFVKSGIRPPQITKDLRPKTYPHFMEKSDKVEHESKTILGKLYDDVKQKTANLIGDDSQELEYQFEFPYFALQVDGYQEFWNDAKTIKSQYDSELRRVMAQYGIKYESELVSGYIKSLHSNQLYKETKMFELLKEVSHVYNGIRDRYVREFWKEFYDEGAKYQEDDVSQVRWNERSRQIKWHNQWTVARNQLKPYVLQRAKQKASAWLLIVYEPYSSKTVNNNHSNTEKSKRSSYFFSSAWLPYPVVLEIYKDQLDLFNLVSG